MVSMESMAAVRFIWVRYQPELTLPDPVRGQCHVFGTIFGASLEAPGAPHKGPGGPGAPGGWRRRETSPVRPPSPPRLSPPNPILRSGTSKKSKRISQIHYYSEVRHEFLRRMVSSDLQTASKSPVWWPKWPRKPGPESLAPNVDLNRPRPGPDPAPAWRGPGQSRPGLPGFST